MINVLVIPTKVERCRSVTDRLGRGILRFGFAPLRMTARFALP